jgi:hypothetical protein
MAPIRKRWGGKKIWNEAMAKTLPRCRRGLNVNHDVIGGFKTCLSFLGGRRPTEHVRPRLSCVRS